MASDTIVLEEDSITFLLDTLWRRLWPGPKLLDDLQRASAQEIVIGVGMRVVYEPDLASLVPKIRAVGFVAMTILCVAVAFDEEFRSLNPSFYGLYLSMSRRAIA
jgi:hypothetical protein